MISGLSKSVTLSCEQFDQLLSPSMYESLQKWERVELLKLTCLLVSDPMTRFLSEPPLNGAKLIDHPRKTFFKRVPVRKRSVIGHSGFNLIEMLFSEECLRSLKPHITSRESRQIKYKNGGNF